MILAIIDPRTYIDRFFSISSFRLLSMSQFRWLRLHLMKLFRFQKCRMSQLYRISRRHSQLLSERPPYSIDFFWLKKLFIKLLIFLWKHTIFSMNKSICWWKHWFFNDSLKKSMASMNKSMFHWKNKCSQKIEYETCALPFATAWVSVFQSHELSLPWLPI